MTECHTAALRSCSNLVTACATLAGRGGDNGSAAGGGVCDDAALAWKVGTSLLQTRGLHRPLSTRRCRTMRNPSAS